jgi:iron complex transport system substrate-binding protein
LNKRGLLFIVAWLLAGAAVAAPPQRIVSLVPGLTESVCALGACARLVGTDRYSNWPREVAALPKLGGLDDAQVERIAALRPDLVLIAPSARAAERLRALGLNVEALHTRSHDDVRRNLQRLGELLEEPARAHAAWAQIEQRLVEAAQSVPPSMRGRSVYFEVDATPYAAGPDSFIGQTLQALGLRNIVPAALGPFPKLSPEFVVRAQPQIVVAETRNVQQMPGRPGWTTLTALQTRQLCAFDGERYDLLVRPGPRLGEAALLLADCLTALAKENR